MLSITLVGGDASGKTTQLQILQDYFRQRGKTAQVISIWDSLGDFSTPPERQVIKQVVQSALMRFSPEARTHFLVANLLNAASKLDPKSDVVLYNGFFHKYWASEMAYGIPSAMWEAQLGLMPKSDRIFYLRAPYEKLHGRRENWSSYERGEARHHNQATLDPTGLQQRMHGHLDQLMQEVEVVELDADQKVEDIHQRLVGHL